MTCYAVVMAWSLAACGATGPEAQSVADLEDSAHAAQSGDIVMSGRYEMDVATGKLLNPARNRVFERPHEMSGMHEDTAWGARRFAEYFVQVLEYTWKSGDSSLLREVSLPECVWCQRHIERTDERAKNGGWIDDADFTVAKVEDAFEIEGHPGLWNTTMEIVQKDQGYYDGTKLEEGIENRTRFLVQSRFEDGRWRAWAAVGEEDIQE